MALGASLAAAPATGASELPVGATLTILAGDVEVASADDGIFVSATQGQAVRPGDQVRTSSGAVALLTFFDGSESQIAAESQVQVEQADYDPAPRIALYQTAGVTVNRVVPLPPGGSFRTDTPDATGLVRGTSYVVSVAPATAPCDDVAPVAAPQSSTSVVLLTDLDGHVGKMHVVPAQQSTGSTVELTRPGDVGGATGQTTTAAHLDDGVIQRLELAAHNLHDANSSQTAGEQARQVGKLLAPALTSTGSGTGNGTKRVGEATRSDDAHPSAGDARPLADDAHPSAGDAPPSVQTAPPAPRVESKPITVRHDEPARPSAKPSESGSSGHKASDNKSASDIRPVVSKSAD